MKLSLFATAAVAAAAIAAPALAQPVAVPASNYVQFNIGSGIAGQSDIEGTFGAVSDSADVDLDAGLFASVAAGHNFGNGLALELEGVYLNNDLNQDDVDDLLGPVYGAGVDGNVDTWGVLANAKYEFNTGWNNVSPYVGAGLGYGNVNYDFDGLSDDQSGFMWQVKAGLAIHTNDRLTWDIGYRYLRAPEYEVSDTVGGTAVGLEANTGTHVLSAGARVNF